MRDTDAVPLPPVEYVTVVPPGNDTLKVLKLVEVTTCSVNDMEEFKLDVNIVVGTTVETLAEGVNAPLPPIVSLVPVSPEIERLNAPDAEDTIPEAIGLIGAATNGVVVGMIKLSLELFVDETIIPAPPVMEVTAVPPTTVMLNDPLAAEAG